MKASENARPYSQEIQNDLVTRQNNIKAALQSNKSFTTSPKYYQKPSGYLSQNSTLNLQNLAQNYCVQYRKNISQKQKRKIPSQVLLKQPQLQKQKNSENIQTHNKSFSVTRINKDSSFINNTNSKLNITLDNVKNNSPQTFKMPSSQTLSFKQKLNQKISKAVSSQVSPHKMQFSSESLELELKMTEQLKLLSQSEVSVMTNKKLQIYRQTFNQVIDRDKQYGNLLFKIKAAYEESFNNNEQVTEREQILVKEVRRFKSLWLKEKEDKQQFEKKLEAISKENLDLSRNADQKDQDIEQLIMRYEKLQNQYQKQQKVIDLLRYQNQSPKTQLKQNFNDRQIIQKLNQENQMLKKCLQSNQLEFDIAKKKEMKFQYIIEVLKSNGIPVEDIYENQVRQKIKSTPSGDQSTTNSSNSTASRVKQNQSSTQIDQSQRIQDMQLPQKVQQEYIRPENVPPLDFSKLYKNDQAEEDEEEISSIQYQEEQIYIDSQNQILKLKDNKTKNFQEEFLENAQFFSESWRAELDKLKT